MALGVQNEAGQRLTEFCQQNALVIVNTLSQQHKRRLYTWTSPDGQHQNQIDYILCSQRWRSSIQSAKTKQGDDCGSDHELLIAKIRLQLTKVGETTRPFRYDLNQIPYDYTVGVRNRFFLELSCFFHDPADVGNLISGSSAFSKTSLNIWKFTVHVLPKPGLENFEHYFTSMCKT